MTAEVEEIFSKPVRVPNELYTVNCAVTLKAACIQKSITCQCSVM